MISRAKKYVAVLLAFVCVCMIFSPQTAYADEDSSQHETVKVGFFAMDGYHVMDEEGNRSGYGYDFLRLMARYWDVDYEYVGYDKSWDDMQQMLEDGEIDMVTSPRKTQEREEKFDFSRPIGTNNGILTVRSDNSTIVDGNYSTYNGMRVAFLNGSSEIKSFADFAGNKGFTYDPFYFDTTAEMEEALQSGNVDAIAASSLRKTNNERIVDKFDSSDFYVMVKKGNTELLNEINYAIDQMNAVEGDWKTTLHNKNYESIETKNLEYTKKEKSIISQYSKDNPLHVLCDPTRYPYFYNENGEMKGIIPDYFRKIADYAGISYEFLTPATRDEYIAYQKNKETTDISIDARLETDNYAETKKWGITAPFITMQLARVTRRDFDGKINVVTTVDQTVSNSIEDAMAPGAEKLMCSTRQEMMEAVRKGKITFESEKGVGTTFVIRVPFKIDPDADKREEQKEVSEKSIKGLHILLAEDNELNMEIAEFMLQNEGADVTKAWNGQEAVELFRKSEPGEFDVILMDIMMPVMNGYEAAKTIRSLNREDAKTIPIIAMTANAFTEDRIKAKEAGMDEHVAKPVDMELLIKVIHRLVG